MVTDDPSDIPLVVSAVIGDDIAQIFPKQSNLNHGHNFQHLKSFVVVCSNLCIQFWVMMLYCTKLIFQCFRDNSSCEVEQWQTACFIHIFIIIYSGPCSSTPTYTHYQHEMYHTVFTREERSLRYRMINVFYNNVWYLLIIGLAHSSISLGCNNCLWWLCLEK
jgi:hypothetical protein